MGLIIGGLLLLIFVLVIVLVIAAIFYFNKLVGLKNRCKQSWSDIDTQLQRRYDLIPNLVETVKGYAGHERTTLEAVIKARQQAIEIKGDNIAAKAAAENILGQTLKSLFAVAEAYPQLRANENFMSLQKDLAQIEEQLNLARRYYNAVARDNNNAVEMFPSNIVARLFNFKTAEYFELGEEEARKAPKVQF